MPLNKGNVAEVGEFLLAPPPFTTELSKYYQRNKVNRFFNLQMFIMSIKSTKKMVKVLKIRYVHVFGNIF